MAKNLPQTLDSLIQNESPDNRREYIRRHTDHCVAQLGEQAHPVIDWSQGGVLIHANDEGCLRLRRYL